MVGIVEHSVILEGIPENCRVYCFVFGSSDADEKTKKDLETLGTEYGDNLFVGFWSMKDSRYSYIASCFNLRSLPAIVFTAESHLGGTEEDNSAPYVRLDDSRVLSDIDGMKQLIRLLYNLFITGKVAEAIKEAKKARKVRRLRDIIQQSKKLVSDIVGRIIENYNIDFEYGPFKVELIR